MISEFSLDKKFFSSAILRSESMSVAHDYLTSSWLDFGVLILPRAGSDDFLELINSLPNKFRQRWAYAFEYAKRGEVEREWWDFGGYDSFESLCELSGVFKTAFAEETIGYVLAGEESSKKICEVSAFEMLGVGVCSESVHINRSFELSRADIFECDAPEFVWQTRFNSLAKYSKKITIIDRYFFECIWDAAKRDKVDSALMNFFRYISRLDKKFNVKIISHGGERHGDFYSAINSVFQRLLMKNPKFSSVLESLTLVSANNEFFRDQSHDRFIGFDRHVCQVGNGMRVLADAPTPRSTFLAKFDRAGELAAREVSAGRSAHKLWSETY